jgi:hypothetical protein
MTVAARPGEPVEFFLPRGSDDAELCMPVDPDDHETLIERVDGRRHGELLPLSCLEAPLYVYNPWILPNALDDKGSEILRFDEGRIMGIDLYVFHEEIVRGVDAFKLEMRASPTLVSRRFVNRWRESGLWGLDFDLVWDGIGHRLSLW